MVYIYNPHARSTFVSGCTSLIAPFLSLSEFTCPPNISFHEDLLALSENSLLLQVLESEDLGFSVCWTTFQLCDHACLLLHL